MKDIYLIVFGNILGLIGSIFMVCASNSKKQENVVKLQVIQLFMLSSSNLVLGAFTGCISGFISIVRNILCVNNKMNNTIKFLLLASFIGLTCVFNTNGIVGWLPAIASMSLTIGLDVKNQKMFRFSIWFSCVVFSIFDFFVKNYITCIFDIATIFVATRRLVETFSKNEDANKTIFLENKCA